MRVGIRRIRILEKKQLATLSEWKETPARIFDRTQSSKIRQIEQLERIKQDPVYLGAIGEAAVLRKLSELGDEYHILCGLNIELPRWISYDRRRNLKSAQMDFVIVSSRGVILIEVKNWSNRYQKGHSGLGPHEQTDRAGRVLWKELQSWSVNPRITNLLLSMKGNIEYDPRYKHVLVSSLDKINYFIQKGHDELSEKEVAGVVNALGRYVTR